MKNLLGTITALLVAAIVHAQVTVKGTVKSNDNAPLQGATITIISNNQQLSTTSNANGLFTISNIPDNTNAVVTATYVNKQSASQNITIGIEDITVNFTLPDAAYTLEPLEVRSTRASDKAPFTKTNLTTAEIKKNNIGQDLPFILNQTPSVVVNSDAGNGVGYTGIRIRGTDATRINVTLNGIPYNDAESGGTYFVDLPDFASSVSSIQVQRGVGTSTNGAGAFGATINLSTNELHDTAYAEANNSFGSFNTWKNTIRVGSGLLNNHFTVDARLSRITSDGFVDRAKSNLQSAIFLQHILANKHRYALIFSLAKRKPTRHGTVCRKQSCLALNKTCRITTTIMLVLIILRRKTLSIFSTAAEEHIIYTPIPTKPIITSKTIISYSLTNH